MKKKITSILLFIPRLFVYFWYIIKSIYFNFKKANGLDEKHDEDSTFKIQKSPYQVVITNDTDVQKEAVVFGCAEYIFAKNFGNDDGVTVTPSCSNVTYGRLLLNSAIFPFKSHLMRLQSRDENNVKNIASIKTVSMNGEQVTIPLILINYIREDQFLKTINDVNFKIDIDLNTEIRFNINPKSSMVATFFPE